MPCTNRAAHPVHTTTLLIATLTYCVVALVNIRMGQISTALTPSVLWVPSGIGVALVLHYGPILLPAIFCGNIISCLLGTGLPYFSILASCGNTLEALTACLLLQRFYHAHPTPPRLSQVLAFMLRAVLVAPLASTLFGVLGFGVEGVNTWSNLHFHATLWWLGNAQGILIVAPFTLALLRGKESRQCRISRREKISLLAGLLLVSLAVFGGWLPQNVDRSLAFLLLPFVVWGVLRLSMLGQTCIVMLISVVAVSCTLHGLGPFAQDSVLASLITVSVFLAVTAFMSLILGATTSDRRHMETELHRHMKQLRLLADNYPDGHILMLDDTLHVTFSGGTGFIDTAAQAPALEGKRPNDFLPQETLRQVTPMLHQTFQGKIQHKEIVQGDRVFDVSTRPVLERDGRIAACLMIALDVTERVRAREVFPQGSE